MSAVVWRANLITEACLELNRWIMVWSAFVFFGIFGLTEEARNHYRAALQSVLQVFMKITGMKKPTGQPAAAKECVTYLFFLISVLICYLD